MLKINTNLSSLIVQSNLQTSTLGLNQAIERMTTGFKINGAKDNAAGYSIVTNMTTKIGAYQVAEDNVMVGLDMVLTASNSLSTMSDLTIRLRNLAIQVRNGTYGNTSLDAINLEGKSIIDELYRIYETAEYNGIRLFNDFSSTVPEFDDGNKLVPNEMGFLQDIARRDTTAMDKLADVDPNQTLSSGTYSISTAEELVKLSEMSNAGKITGACEFVMANDIDISEFCMANLDSNGEGGWNPIGNLEDSKFDGNGYTVSGLYINRPTKDGQALFSGTKSLIFNIGVLNPKVIGKNAVGGVLAGVFGRAPQNCYVEGGSISGTENVGGICGNCGYSSASYCYTTCDVTGVKNVGGIGGRAVYTMTYSYSTGNITGQTNVGGIVGELLNGAVHKCAVYGAVSGNSDTTGIIGGSMSGKVTDCMYNKNVNQDLGLVGENFTCTITNTTGIDFGAKVNLQVGINSDLNNQISFDAWFALDGLSRLKNLNLQDNSVLKIIDSILSQINKKQTEYGSVENRLESVLEEISIHYENLVSSRSTIRDADIAEESSEYIKMQILQQASATLLATANQTPAIALQLL